MKKVFAISIGLMMAISVFGQSIKVTPTLKKGMVKTYSVTTTMIAVGQTVNVTSEEKFTVTKETSNGFEMTMESSNFKSDGDNQNLMGRLATLGEEMMKDCKIQIRLDKEGRVETVTVDMGAPILEDENLYNPVLGKNLSTPLPCREGQGGGSSIFVSMGNPHFVIFTDEDVEKLPIEVYGPQLEHHPAFPQRCNIEFAQLRADGTVRMRVWERGSGITLACGTGACATAVAAAITGRTGRRCTIEMDGGVLQIEWDEATNHVLKTGPAAIVFEGTINLF